MFPAIQFGPFNSQQPLNLLNRHVHILRFLHSYTLRMMLVKRGVTIADAASQIERCWLPMKTASHAKGPWSTTTASGERWFKVPHYAYMTHEMTAANRQDILTDVLIYIAEQGTDNADMASDYMYLHHHHLSSPFSSIHIHFRLRCCPCPILWGWQHRLSLSPQESLCVIEAQAHDAYDGTHLRSVVTKSQLWLGALKTTVRSCDVGSSPASHATTNKGLNNGSGVRQHTASQLTSFSMNSPFFAVPAWDNMGMKRYF